MLTADRLLGVKPSAYGRATQRARELLAAGVDAIIPTLDKREQVAARMAEAVARLTPAMAA